MCRSNRDVEVKYFEEDGKYFRKEYGFRGTETNPVWVNETKEITKEQYEKV